MAKKRKKIPDYGTVVQNGIEYYRTRIVDADGKRVALYGKTKEELYDKVEEAKRMIEDASFRRENPTVKEYAEKWLLMQSAHVRDTTMIDYRSKVKNYTVKPVLGEKAAHNNTVVYSMDFQVTPHQLRHTYITNLIYAAVDPKTVQYLAGHENSKITMDIYAKVKYNRPQELAAVVNSAFNKG